ncbi:MAG TPA: gliding motility-associated C-terminal domain-containing protein, partial [Paludibacteraceae bacterium]|nr:gliding motility-associated C-terminal domain-containing protein [Paludibacteraceae bacterium]
MMQPEDFIYPIVNKTYCFDDTVSLNASSSNATMTWEDQSTGEVLYGNSFKSKLDGETDILLIATVTNKPVCQDTVSLTIKTYPKIEPEVIGKTNVCLDSAINLTTGNLYQTVWTVSDSTIAGDNFRYTPSKSELVQVYGLDKNKCPVTKTISINTVNNPDPKIIIDPMIASATYHLNRDTFDVRLEGVITAPLDNNYTYYWDFGDGYKDTESNSSTVEHSYEANLVRLTKPINVQLIVTHEYGCKGMAVATLLIDPDFEVPNTMTPEDEFMEDYELQIYDRIGNLIYEGIGWHGQKDNGEEAFADTYFYAITYYISGEKKIQTGYITLVR